MKFVLKIFITDCVVCVCARILTKTSVTRIIISFYKSTPQHQQQSTLKTIPSTYTISLYVTDMVVQSSSHQPSVAIIGGGIIGVTTGLAIQRQCPGVRVTIFSDTLSPHTTADGAAGLFSLFLLGDTPLDKQVGFHSEF